jgi:antirestriction protein ArdC
VRTALHEHAHWSGHPVRLHRDLSGRFGSQAYAVEEKAVEAYRVAYERSMELKITNVWTKKTLEALNLLRAAPSSSEWP